MRSREKGGVPCVAAKAVPGGWKSGWQTMSDGYKPGGGALADKSGGRGSPSPRKPLPRPPRQAYCTFVALSRDHSQVGGRIWRGGFGFRVCRRGKRNSAGGTTAAAPPHIGPESCIAVIIRNRDLQVEKGVAIIYRGQPKMGFAHPVAPCLWQDVAGVSGGQPNLHMMAIAVPPGILYL